MASGIYAWASAPSRRLAPRNPLRLVELPPNDENPRLRVALACEPAACAGLRRSELYRLEWPDLLESEHMATRLLVRRSKSEAGTQRRPPIAQPAPGARGGLGAPGPCTRGKVVDRSAMSGEMAAGYTIKELMEFVGHADLQMVNRYVKLLPQPGEDDAADRLNAHLRRTEEQ